jgi:hypothetical protein
VLARVGEGLGQRQDRVERDVRIDARDGERRRHRRLAVGGARRPRARLARHRRAHRVRAFAERERGRVQVQPLGGGVQLRQERAPRALLSAVRRGHQRVVREEHEAAGELRRDPGVAARETDSARRAALGAARAAERG